MYKRQGHAAYATAWLAVALAASWRLGVASRVTLALAAIGLAVAIGVSRIYLRAHYFSDVAGGWGLGLGIFGVLAAVALIVVHIRNNDWAMDFSFSIVEITLVVAAGVVGAGYLALIVAPAWQCYGRSWEKLSAAFLTLFMLATLLGIGAGIGLAIVWTYDTYA